MNRNSLVLLLVLVLIGVGAYAAIGWQRGNALAPEALASAGSLSSGGLVINAVVIPGEGAVSPPPATSTVVPALAPAADAAACP